MKITEKVKRQKKTKMEQKANIKQGLFSENKRTLLKTGEEKNRTER